jgi:signal transduction histidine kinase
MMDHMFLNIKDITVLIKNLESLKDKVYQDAIENNFSHEIMTPLNPIINFASLLKQDILQHYYTKNNIIYDRNNQIEGQNLKALSEVVQD